MKKTLLILLSIVLLVQAKSAFSQTTLDTAVNFYVKTIDGVSIRLLPILDDDNKIVVIDFFSTTCIPCQDYAPDFQSSYEDFGENSSNVYYMGINQGNNNKEVRAFDSTYNLTYPTVSGTQGGGNDVFTDYNILSYPTVIVIVPEDHIIKNKQIVPPVRDSINKAVIAAGGIMVGINENHKTNHHLVIYPNPVRDITNVNFNLKSKSTVSISVYDMPGKEVQKYGPQLFLPGSISIPLSLGNLQEGIYFIRIKFNNIVLTHKIIKTIY